MCNTVCACTEKKKELLTVHRNVFYVYIHMYGTVQKKLNVTG